MHGSRKSHKTALEHILLGLLPYSRENFALVFKPHIFFNELEQISGYSRQTIQSTYYRAYRQGYVKKHSDGPALTREGERLILPYQAQKLGRGARLVVMFDIPEPNAKSRQAFRRWLKKLGFTMIQQSIWVSDMDYRQALIEMIVELTISDYVELHESVKLYPHT